MRYVASLGLLLVMTSTSFADGNARTISGIPTAGGNSQ